MAYLYKSFNGMDLPSINVDSDIGPGDALQALSQMPNGALFDHQGSARSPRDKREISIKCQIWGNDVPDLLTKFRLLKRIWGTTGELKRTFQKDDLTAPIPQIEQIDETTARIHWNAVPGAEGYRVEIIDALMTPAPQVELVDETTARIFWDAVPSAEGYRVEIEELSNEYEPNDNFQNFQTADEYQYVDQVTTARCIRMIGDSPVFRGQKFLNIEMVFMLIGSRWRSVDEAVIDSELRMGVDEVNIAKADYAHQSIAIKNDGDADVEDVQIGIFGGDKGLTDVRVELYDANNWRAAKCGFIISQVEAGQTLWVDTGNSSVVTGTYMLISNGTNVYERFSLIEPHLHAAWFPISSGESEIRVMTGNWSLNSRVTVRYCHAWL